MPVFGGGSSPLAVNGISLGWLRSTIGSPVASSMPLTFPALCTVMSVWARKGFSSRRLRLPPAGRGVLNERPPVLVAHIGRRVFTASEH